MGQWDLPEDRPATMDEKGWRVYLFPAEVRGFWRLRRERLQLFLIGFFLVLPWIKIGGQQALLLDIGRRHFDIFGLSLRAHNAPLLFFIFAGAGFSLFFVTAIWGRLWCGWACPQTVFIEGVFRRIERLVEGTAAERKLLARGPWTTQKVMKVSAKWILFVVAALIITHSFLAYFVGADRLMGMVLRRPSENWVDFLFIAFSTAIILFDFAWFREQFCLIACPYGRFQSVLMDEHSLVVGYDEKRGEPRRGKAAPGESTGDCVNCYRCVQVCPTGIDIRRGTQMECVACTSCIDACDDVMEKLNKPSGLIRYTTENELKGLPRKKMRVRTGVYLLFVGIALGALAYFLGHQVEVDLQVLRAKTAPYQVVSGGVDVPETITNQFYVEISNQGRSQQSITVELLEPKERGVGLVFAPSPFLIKPGESGRPGLFVKFPVDLLKNGQAQVKLKLTAQDEDQVRRPPTIVIREVPLVGPIR